MNSYINATFIGDKKTGLVIYGKEVILRLCKIYREKENFIFLTHMQLEKCRTLYLPNKLSMDCGKKAIWRRLLFYYRFTFKKAIFYSPIPEGPLVGRLRKIITLHDLIPIILPEGHTISYLYYKYYLPPLLKDAYKIVVPSEKTKMDVMERFKISEEKITVIYNGYDPAKFYPDPERILPYDYFLFVGENRPYKNLKRVIRAFSYFSEDFYLVIVGNMKNATEIQGIIYKYGISDRVVFMRNISESTLRKLYSHAEALIFPSLYEGFGLPALEALACKCPVVTAKGSPMEEFCKDGALYVDPYDIESIVDAMNTILDKEKRREIIDRGQKNVFHLTWDLTAERIKKVIDEAEDL